MYPVILAGQNITLREFASQDADLLHEVYGDPEATRHLSFEPRSREQVVKLVTDIIGRAKETPRTEYALAVARNQDNQLIGMARLALGEHRSGQIGFAIRADQWGRGFGTETVRLLLDLGFQHLALHRIWGARSPLNTDSDRVMTKAGMVEEGRIRDHVYVRGAWRDSITHSILEHEWNAPAAP